MEKKKNNVEEEQRETEAQQQSTNTSSKKKKRKLVFPFGNYRNYYGYRLGQGLDEDPRLRVLKKSWFEGKDCLDIGCNCGVITIQIAKKFHCQSILGIDVDSNLVEDAYWHLRKIMKMEQAEKQASASEVFKQANGSEKILEKEIARDCSSPVQRDLSKIVSFQHENIVHSRLSIDRSYDTILCLSVTKWIQLNWGDDGLVTLFSKIWRLLRPGGIFVLEPQPWVSYEKNRLVSETTSTNYHNIKIFPNQFQEILLDKIGFRTVEDISAGGLSDSKTGFNRPIFAFQK